MSEPAVIRVAFRGTLGRFTLDAAFTAPAIGITGLFGPSGCGKTTILRCIAGLQRLSRGFCSVDGDVWQDGPCFRPTHKRRIGYVFQEASLFAHLSVSRNLLYGAPGRGKRPQPCGVGFDEVVDLLGLESLLDRAPRNLSGGERQRVAIGRALLSEPKLLLMDEPLSALDLSTKREILPFLERLHTSLSLPVIYVSHDMAEIERLADHLVLMEAGRTIAAGRLPELQADPSLPLARTRDSAVTLDGRIEAYDPADGLLTLAVKGARFFAPGPAGTAGERRRFSIAAGDVSLTREMPRASTILNILPARIIAAAETGKYEMIVVLGLGPDGAGDRIMARVTRRSWTQLGLSAGMAVYSQVKSVALAAAHREHR